ncbi:MAG TPA: polymer-forming cytoskeletal protein [Spirochaetota bacterium]|nr:polymer-forming cytoskeletal protein [Spirochaetota bacterium]
MALKPDKKVSVISKDSVFEGNFFVNGTLQVAGKFEGTIKTSNQVVILESGRVKTNLNAQKVIISGTFIGNINAGKIVKLTSTGKCIGNITTPVLNLEKGALTKGDINITGSEKLDVNKIVKDSYASTPGFDSLTGKNNNQSSKKTPKKKNKKSKKK